MSSSPRGGDAPRLSVVIPTLGNYGGLQRVLDGFARQSVCATTFEVIVVSDVTEPDPARADAAIGTRPYRARRLTADIPGASANRNAGWRAAEAPLVLFTDNDTIPTRRLVAEHLDWHRREPGETAAILGNVRWSREVEITTFMRWLDTGLQFNFANLDPGKVHWGAFASANVSMKRSFLARLDGFDAERFPYLAEDTELAYRASQAGMRLFYNPRARVDHLRTMSFELVTRRVRRMAAAEHLLAQVHPELEPWWHRIFTQVSAVPPGNGRGLKLAFVPRRTPWLGRRVWSSIDLYYKQALAPHFLDAWEATVEGRAGDQPAAADLLVDSSGGSSPGGP